MNQEEIIRALEICSKDDDDLCDTCPVESRIDCSHNLMLEARNLILSLLERPAVDDRQESEHWTRHRVLKEAEKCVCGQREQDYGGPEDSFRLIAELWEPYIREMLVSKGADVSIEPHDVAVMMALLKIARISKNPQHMDSWVDGCGYFACGGEIAGKEME